MLFFHPWDDHLGAFLPLFILSFSAFGVICFVAIKGRLDGLPRLQWYILAGAVLFRLTVFFPEPSLSEDIYRYIWDGRVQAAGLDPYRAPPRDPQFQKLHDEQYEKVQHKQFFTPYPPLAENVFHLLARISPSLLLFKFFFFAVDLGLVEILRRLLIAENMPPSRLLIYAWHPMVILEFSNSAHVDVLAIFLTCLAFYLSAQKKAAASFITLGAAVMTKYLPVFSLPYLLRKHGWKNLLFFGAVCGLLVFQFYSQDLALFQGVTYFYRKFRFNDSAFGFFYSLADHDAVVARRIGLSIVIATFAFCWLRKWEIYKTLLYTFGAIIIVSQIVHPWYVAWMIPLMLFVPSWPWLFFSGWVVMSYIIRDLYPVLWRNDTWLRTLVYAPFYLMLLIAGLRNLLARRQP